MKQESGFLTLEFTTALAVFTVVTMLSAGTVFSVGDIASSLSARAEALQLAAEDARKLTGFTGQMQNVPLQSDVPVPYILHRELIPFSPCVAKVEESVTWQGARVHTVSLTTILQDLQTPRDLGNDCPAVGVTVPWENITTVSGLILHTRVQFRGVDVVSRNGARIAVVVGSSTQSADPDLYIVDVTTPATPKVLGQLHTGPGLFAVDVAGTFAYAVQNSQTKQLQIIDFSDREHPYLAASVSLPNVSGLFPEGRSVYVFRNRVYIGTYETAGAEFHVFDITDPYAPIFLGSRAVNHSIRNIIVRPELIDGSERLVAYLASSGNSAEVLILDVTNASAITELSHLDLPGVGSSSALFAADTRLLVGRQQGGGEFAVWSVDISNPLAPLTLRGSGIAIKSGSVVNGLSLSNGQALLTTTDSLGPLIVCKADAEFELTNCKRATLFTDPGRIDVQDNQMFVAAGHTLTIVTGQ